MFCLELQAWAVWNENIDKGQFCQNVYGNKKIVSSSWNAFRAIRNER